MHNTLGILLAGGAGERLHPLTRHTAKPAVPFGGSYRVIDFTLSNCVNSDIRRIFVLTQYKALELTRHVRDGWDIFSGDIGEFIEVVPPMKRVHEGWYLGTADAVYQNIESIVAEKPEHVLILSGDHIYKMDYREILEWHQTYRADVTIATIQVDPGEAWRFGIVEIEDDYRITGFEEKPKHGNPSPSIFNPNMLSASMGVYVFRTAALLNALREDAEDSESSHDFGHDVLPRLIETTRVVAYDFHDLNQKAARYWRDVGTLDAYYDANMDLVSVTPELNLYDSKWPVRTRPAQSPPAKFVFAHEGRRMGVALDSIVSPGCIVSGGKIVRCILSPGVRINSYCDVQDTILLHNAQVGRYARIRRAIIDSGATVPEGSVIGFHPEQDREKGYHVTESGIVVVPHDPAPVEAIVS
ncbi:MAG: glucose-1-phosphate adenylyltransferase [Bryobacteraceae bacterium]|nr:glucose-1-phosphate adenylyltransferase [Bryobacteraceae bacterium]